MVSTGERFTFLVGVIFTYRLLMEHGGFNTVISMQRLVDARSNSLFSRNAWGQILGLDASHTSLLMLIF